MNIANAKKQRETDIEKIFTDSVHFAGKEKHPNKLMVWVAISIRGISMLLFRQSKFESVNSDIYIHE